MTNLNYQDRNRDFRTECIKYIQEISPSASPLESQQKYEGLMRRLNERLGRSGHGTPTDNIMAIILEEISRLDGQI